MPQLSYRQNHTFLIDAKTDPRSLANPLVAGDFGLRFYVGVPLRTSDGYNLGTLCIIDKEARPIDQSQIDELEDLASIVMDQMELRLSARQAVSRAEIMAREIDHRVMNSLQFISSLLVMQSRAPDLPVVAASQLQMAATRVAAVARVHRNFYSAAAAEVSCITFMRRLCADLSSILGKHIDVHGDDGNVPTTLIQPIGLLVNELVTNAAKHSVGKIDVAYRIRGEIHELHVCDDGAGLPAGFDPEQCKTGLGMKVITILAKQLSGRVTARSNPIGRGACFIIAFPLSTAFAMNEVRQ